jgi:hypothetical protein
MPKKQKTRKQKIQSDQRLKSLPKTSDSTFSLKELPTSSTHTLNTSTVKKTAFTHAITTSDYQYLSKDLAKITVLTAIIVILELFLKTVIQ